MAGCTGDIDLTPDPAGDIPEISSPNYPSPYPNNVDCRLILRSKPGTTMKVRPLLFSH